MHRYMYIKNVVLSDGQETLTGHTKSNERPCKRHVLRVEKCCVRIFLVLLSRACSGPALARVLLVCKWIASRCPSHCRHRQKNPVFLHRRHGNENQWSVFLQFCNGHVCTSGPLKLKSMVRFFYSFVMGMFAHPGRENENQWSVFLQFCNGH